MISGHGADLQFKGSIVIEKNNVVYNVKSKPVEQAHE